jgi:hypothetical protein
MMPEIRKVQYFCTECQQKSFGDPEEATSFAAWMATVRGHIISFHRALKSNEEPNAFLKADFLHYAVGEIVPKTPARVGAR